jgi:hypothetical protein
MEYVLAGLALLVSVWSAHSSRRSADAAAKSARFAERWAQIDAVKKRAEVADQVLVAALAVIDDMDASFGAMELGRSLDGTEWQVDERQARILEVARCRHLCTVHLPDFEKTILEVAEAAQGLLDKQKEYMRHTTTEDGWHELYQEAAHEERLKPKIEALRTKVLKKLQPIATLSEG